MNNIATWIHREFSLLRRHAVLTIPPICAAAVVVIHRIHWNEAVACHPESYLKAACYSFNFRDIRALPSVITTSNDIVARVLWQSALVLLIVVALVGIALSALVIIRALRDNRNSLNEMFALIASSAVLAALLSFELGHQFITVDFLFFRSRAFEYEGADLREIVDRVRAVTAFAAVFIVAGAAATLDTRAREEAAEELHERIADLNLILYLGAALLVTALIEFAAFQGVALAALNPAKKEALAAVTQAASASTASSGIIYATTLAALYIPALAVLHHQRNGLYKKYRASLPAGAEALPRVKWLEQNGLSSTTPSNAIRWIAVLSPLVAASPLASLLKLIT